MNPLTSTAPRTTVPTQPATRQQQAQGSSSSSSFANPIDAFQTFNPMNFWSTTMGTWLQMVSPLGYGAMRGPLGY